MVQALPIHIVYKIERRWKRRFDAQPRVKPGKVDGGSARLCPLCKTAVLVAPASRDHAGARRGYVCSNCGYAWRSEAQ